MVEDCLSRQELQTQQLIHDLRVHQTELEAQNEELCRTQSELEAARARYFDLYDLAPVGYCTLSENGLILEANFTASTLLGVVRSELITQAFTQFILKDDQDLHHLHFRQLREIWSTDSIRLQNAVRTYELRMMKADGTLFSAHVDARIALGAYGAPVCRVVISDVTERRQAEAVQTFLARTSAGTAVEPFFQALARYLAQSLGMDFVCIDSLEGVGLRARTLAVWCDGRFEDNVTYALKDTPCGDVVGQTVCCFPASVCQFFPRDQVLRDLRAESYVGATLWSHAGQPIGLIAVIGRRPLANRSQAEATLALVSERAARELERHLAEEVLRERLKELDCLYAVANVIEHETSLEKILQETVEIMPHAWFHNEIACARIVLDGQEFRSANFREPVQKQASGFIVHGKPVGTVELGYLEERPIEDEGPFFAEERSLINAIAGRLGRVVERKRAEETLSESEAALQHANAELESANRDLQLANETLDARVAARTADLADRASQLKALARDLTRAEETERRRVARVIHDHLQQLLSVARINLGMVLGQVRHKSIHMGLSDVDSLLAESLDVTRSLTAELSPTILYRSGLPAALRWLGRWYDDRFGLTVVVDIDADVGADVDEEIRTMLFRSARELLFNVVKHARVTRAWVRLSHAADGRVCLDVSDDGIGFDPETLRAGDGSRESFGLFSLRERIDLLGGQLVVDSAPGRGASFKLFAPLPQRGAPVAPAIAAASPAPPAVAARRPTGVRHTPARRKKR